MTEPIKQSDNEVLVPYSNVMRFKAFEEVEKLQSELTQAREEIDRLSKLVGKYREAWGTPRAEKDAEIKRLREALGRIANDEFSDSFPTVGQMRIIALEALAKEEGGEG